MADALDEGIENLKAFNTLLAESLGQLARDTATLQNGIPGFESVQSAWQQLADEGRAGGFTATLGELDEALEEGVEGVAAATAAVKTLAAEKESGDLAAAKARADAEAQACETLEKDASRRWEDAAIALRIASVKLSDQAVWVGVALGRLESGATAAFAAVGKVTAEIVSELAGALERTAEEAGEYASSLEPATMSFDEALEGFSSTAGAAAQQLERALASSGEALRGAYAEWEETAKATGARVQAFLAAELAELATLLEARCAGIQTDGGAVALDQALARVGDELAQWRDRIEDRGDFLAGLPDLAADLRNAHAIAATVVGVLDVL